ncbi:MAG: flagellar hook-associated protein FlgK [Subdoligranulum sp.]|nr:flagellar hook-associated protein FlgK [Subdoligranulum sp.]
MIRPTFLGFDTAKKGLTTAQKGIDIAGQNLVNWDSEGYTRQRIEQVALSQDNYSSRFSSNRVAVAGQGVDIVGISQQRDSFLDKRYREQYGDVGYFDKVDDILKDIQSSLDILDAQGDSGLRGRMMALLDSLDVFSGQPDSPTNANIVATNVKKIADTLKLLDGKLAKVQEQHTYDMSVEVDEYNQMLAKVAEINRVILEDSGVINNDARYGPNELYDERNSLIDKLSNMTDISVTHNVDGTVTLEAGGKIVVQGKKYETLDMSQNKNTGVISLRWLSTGEPVQLETGSIKASADYINGRGNNIVNPGETSERGVLYYKDQLDYIAQTFADVMNSTIPAGYKGQGPESGLEEDADGNVLYKTLIGTTDGSGKITAGNISISEDWAKDSNYLMTQRGNLDTTYILKLKERLNSDETNTFKPDGATEGFTGTFLDYFKVIGTTLGSDISYSEGRYEAASVMASNLDDQRDSVAGVNVDEETANLMLYNKSLAAASRLMTTLDDALDVLINRTGRVGL